MTTPSQQGATPRTDAMVTGCRVDRLSWQSSYDRAASLAFALELQNADLTRQLAEARDLVSERESRLANVKFLLEPIYGSTNYAPIGGTIDRVLNICDRFELPVAALAASPSEAGKDAK